jgi:hypothetical protein
MILFFIIIIYILYLIYWKPKQTTNLEKFVQPSLSNKSIIIGGTCRDVAEYIESIISHIDECGEKFKNYHVVIFENDSLDSTKEKLINLKKQNYTYIFEDGLANKEKSRTRRLEHARNQVLKTVMELNKTNEYDYLLLLDMDNVNSKGTFVKTIDSCFDPSIKSTSWDVQTANQYTNYYDRWALRIPKIFNYDCWKKIKKHGYTEENIKKYVYPNINFGNKLLIPVKSAFGGTALYKLSSIPSYCKYNGTHPTGEEKCEHVDFHKCIGNAGGKIYINTKFINDG